MAKKVKKVDKVKKKPAVKAAKPAKKVAKAAPPKKAAKPVVAKKAAAPKKSPVPVKAVAPKKGAEKVDKKKAGLAAKAPASAKPLHPAKPLQVAKPPPSAKPIPAEKVAKKGKGKAEEAAPEAPETEAAAAGEEEEGSDEVVLTDAEGRRYCRVKDCDQLSAVDGYCRYHYLLYWKKIQVRKKILTEGKLERYVEELTSRYPDKFLDMLKKDLRSEKEFLAAIQELEIDESANENELEDETQTYIDEVRGMGETPAREDDGEF